jgi:hypothetical protein
MRGDRRHFHRRLNFIARVAAIRDYKLMRERFYRARYTIAIDGGQA